MPYWTLLGLEPGTDELGIRRRYAQLLKALRPEDNPEAFQALRNAYEAALSRARQNLGRGTPENSGERIGTKADDPQSTFKPKADAVETLLEGIDDKALEDRLSRANGLGLRERFEQRLLERCLNGGEAGMALAELVVEPLRWLTPWQSPGLSPFLLERLAQRLLDRGLGVVQQALRDGRESDAVALFASLARTSWLQAIDRRAVLSQRTVTLLLDSPDWGPKFFERVRQMLGWDERDSALPCPAWQWQRILELSAGREMLARLRRQLAKRWPVAPDERAAWLLLKPMGATDRRVMVDRFGEAEWAACLELERKLTQRFPELLEAPTGLKLQDWRAWRQRSSVAGCGGLWLLLLALQYDWQGNEIFWQNNFAGLMGHLLSVALITTLLLALLSGAMRAGRLMARGITRADVALSLFLLPPRVTRDGAGLLLGRQILPCLLGGLLVFSLKRELDGLAWLIGACASGLLLLHSNGTIDRALGRLAALARQGTGMLKQVGGVTLGVLVIAVLLVHVDDRVRAMRSTEKPFCAPMTVQAVAAGLCSSPRVSLLPMEAQKVPAESFAAPNDEPAMTSLPSEPVR